LFLVRHGETDHNKGGLALGRADVPLNDTGRDQVRRVADALSAEEFAALFSSPLQRTRSTAEAIAQRTDRPVTVDERLIEMDVGQLDGMPMADVRAQHPDFLEKWVGPDGHQLRMPGGESLEDVRDRSWAFVQELALQHIDTTVCVVTHNFVILTLLTTALGLELSAFRRVRHSVAAISVIDVTGDKTQLARMNDTCHLG
jgi:broad specificity phosphatase PhoE